MAKRGKKYVDALKKYDKRKAYSPREALEILPQISYANFDETVEVHYRLGVDPRHADQQVRGTVLLPHGTGKQVRVLAIVNPEKEDEAKEAGADYVGGEEMVKKIQQGWLDFDVVVATPDMMRFVSRVGKILGPRGLMPSPKAGTVTFDVGEAIRELKKGRIEFKVDKYGIIHAIIGKKSFGTDKLYENLKALTEAIIRAKPAASKGQYLKSVYVCTTMSPSVKLDVNQLRKEAMGE